MYPDNIYAGEHKNPIHDYTGASGENEYLNASDVNEVMGCVSYGTGRTGHIIAIETALGAGVTGGFTNVDARIINIEMAKGSFATIDARLDDYDVTLGTYAHGGFTNITARFLDIDKAKGTFTTIDARLDDYDVTLGTYAHGGFTNITARFLDIDKAKGTFTTIDDRLDDYDVTLGTYAHGGFTNITARFLDIDKAKGTFTTIDDRLDDYDVTLGTYAHGGFTNITARLIDSGMRVEACENFKEYVLNFYYNGPVVTSKQFIAGISFVNAVTASEMIVNAIDAPEGDIGGHVQLCGEGGGGDPVFLTVHMADSDVWGFVSGASCIPAAMPLYLYIPTGSSMGGINVTVRLDG